MPKKRINTLTTFPHIVAFFTIALWGTTFVSTKVLINHGLSPAQIFLLRFIIAYMSIWLICPMRLFGRNILDELIFLALGITGGSLYFLTENEALRNSTATNVSLIVCITPLITTLLLSFFYKSERLTIKQWGGSLLACVGMAIVVLNGHFVLHLSPVGDTLAFSAALCWAFYSLLIKRVSNKYPSSFITRKIFFYGLLTIIPYFIMYPDLPAPTELSKFPVWGNLIFLGLVASMICFVTWNWCIKRIGAVRATNYIYFNPLFTIIAAWLILSEKITLFTLLGAAFLIIGMYIAERRKDAEHQ